MQPRPDFGGMEPAVAIVFALIALLVGLFFLILNVVIWWKICAKAGYSGALGLLMLVPIANFVLLLVLAFGDWPIHRELRSLRGRHIV